MSKEVKFGANIVIFCLIILTIFVTINVIRDKQIDYTEYDNCLKTENYEYCQEIYFNK